MIANPIYLSHYFVTVNDLVQVQENGNLSVNLPDKVAPELFIGKEINYLSPDEYTYYGEFLICEELRLGYIHLIAKDGNIFGQINIDDEIYELQDFGGNKNVLFKIDPSIYTDAECGTETSSPEIGNNNPGIEFRNQACNVRILVLFTDAANMVGNPQNSGSLFVQQTNQIAAQSEADVCFTLAGVEELDGFIETIDPVTTRDNLRNNATANQLRDDFEADLVVLLTDGNWITPFGQTFGISFLNNWGGPDFGYAVAEIDAAGGRYTFSHEVAHDFGCKHDNDNRTAPGFVFDARGHYLIGSSSWPTVMARTGNKSRIPFFSNPDVNILYWKTGVEDERENADQLTAEACNVAGYRDFTPPMEVNISGPIFGNNSGVYTWCANVSQCDDVETVTWEYSLDGINYVLLSSSTLCHTGSLPFDSDVWFRVTVTCEDGQTDTDWHFVWNEDKDDPCHPKFKGGNSPQNIAFLYAYPNPANDVLTLEFELKTALDVEIKLQDLSGRDIHSLVSGKYDAGRFKKSVNISTMPEGYYVVKGNLGDKVLAQSIIKL